MALLRNREVQVVGMSGGEDISQLFIVQYRDGSQEQVPLRQLTLSEDEKTEFGKTNGSRFSDQVNTISDEDYQDIIDAQDPEKIKKNQENNTKQVMPTPVVNVTPGSSDPVTPVTVQNTQNATPASKVN